MASTDKPFSDFYISSLKTNGKTMDIREKDSRGFGVRVLPNGTKKFFYVYNIDGKRRFLNLGTYKDVQHKSGVTLADARKKYIKAKHDVSNAIDPLIEKTKVKVERDRTPFISDFIDEYIREYAKLKTRGWKETERVLQKEIVPRWGKWKITDVRKRDLILLLDEIKARGSRVMANRTLAYTRGMMIVNSIRSTERHTILNITCQKNSPNIGSGQATTQSMSKVTQGHFKLNMFWGSTIKSILGNT